MRDLLLGVERHRAQLAVLVDRARSGRPCGRSSSRSRRTRSARRRPRAASATSARGALDVDLVGQLGIARAGGIADDRGEVHHGVDAVERRRLRASASRTSPRCSSTPSDSSRAATSSCPCSSTSSARTSCPAASSSSISSRADVAGASGDQAPSLSAPCLRLALRQEHRSQLLELDQCLLVILVTSDVEPVPVVQVGPNLAALREQPQHRGREGRGTGPDSMYSSADGSRT